MVDIDWFAWVQWSLVYAGLVVSRLGFLSLLVSRDMFVDIAVSCAGAAELDHRFDVIRDAWPEDGFSCY